MRSRTNSQSPHPTFNMSMASVAQSFQNKNVMLGMRNINTKNSPNSNNNLAHDTKTWVTTCRQMLIDMESKNIKTRAVFWTQFFNDTTSKTMDKIAHVVDNYTAFGSYINNVPSRNSPKWKPQIQRRNSPKYIFQKSPLTLSDFVDSTQMNGQIKCTISLTYDLQIKVTHNFYTQITMITEVKMKGYHPINVSTIHIEPNKCMFAFNIELNDNEIKTQWIKIKAKYNNNFKYSFDIHTIITKIMSKSFDVCEEPQFTTVEISPKYHNIRQYIFAQTVMDLYNLYFSKDILSIIFDQYYPNYFDVYGKPFIYDTLDLKNIKNMFHPHADDYEVTEAFIMTNNKKTICNINGIGIQLSINGNYSFGNYILREYDIDETNLTAIWPMTTSSLSKLKNLQKDLREGYFKRSGAVKAELLLDTNILKRNEFMLWIKWYKKKTYFDNTGYSYLMSYFSSNWTNNSTVSEGNSSHVSFSDTDGLIKELADSVLVPMQFKSKETQDRERIAQIRSCKKQCKRLYNAKFNKYKKYKHNNKYRYHRW